MWQLIGFYLTWLATAGRGRALGAGEVKFTGEVGPEVKLVRYEIDIKRVIKRKLCMAIGDARLLADGKEIYVANDLRGSVPCAKATRQQEERHDQTARRRRQARALCPIGNDLASVEGVCAKVAAASRRWKIHRAGPAQPGGRRAHHRPGSAH